MQFEVTLTGSLPPSLLGCHGDTLVKSRKRHLPHLRTVRVRHLFAPPSKVSLVEVRRRCDVCGRNKIKEEKRAELLQAGLRGVQASIGRMQRLLSSSILRPTIPAGSSPRPVTTGTRSSCYAVEHQDAVTSGPGGDSAAVCPQESFKQRLFNG